MAIVLSGSSIILSALAQDGWTTPGPQPPAREPPWMSQLTDEQKQEIEQLTQSLKDAGATPEEIRDAVNAKLQEWGIEIPEMPAGEPPWMSQLTDEQKEELQQLIQSLTDSGATRDEIRDALNAKLQEWGIQVPEQSGPHQGHFPWMSQLTDDQKEQIQQLIESLRESGATQEETRDAVNVKLEEWGIELPEDMAGQPRLPPWMSQLTDEQKEELQQLIQSLRDSGATQEEIRDAINAKLQEWDIEVPEVPAPPNTSAQ